VFIQMVQVACSQQDDMRMLVDDWCRQMRGHYGWLGGTYGFTDDGQFVGVCRFDGMASAREWCRDPDAGLWWAAAEEMFDGAPEIHESDDVTIMLEGGSDSAGFVQVMRGRVTNLDALKRIMSDHEMTSMLHQARPDIIGATLAIEDDGTFTETVAFTDEAAAREGEKSGAYSDQSDELTSAMEDVEYLDLHHPWFGSS
jgi:hypothetical protein